MLQLQLKHCIALARGVHKYKGNKRGANMINLIIQLLLALQVQDHEAVCKAAQGMNQVDSKVAYQVLESIEPNHAFDHCF